MPPFYRRSGTRGRAAPPRPRQGRPPPGSHAAVHRPRLTAPILFSPVRSDSRQPLRERRQGGESGPTPPGPAPPELRRASAVDGQQGPRPPAALRRGVRKADSDHHRPGPLPAPPPEPRSSPPQRKDRPRVPAAGFIAPPRRYWSGCLPARPITSGWRDRPHVSPSAHWSPPFLPPMAPRGAAWPEVVVCRRLIGPWRRPSQASSSSGCSVEPLGKRQSVLGRECCWGL